MVTSRTRAHRVASAPEPHTAARFVAAAYSKGRLESRFAVSRR